MHIILHAITVRNLLVRLGPQLHYCSLLACYVLFYVCIPVRRRELIFPWYNLLKESLEADEAVIFIKSFYMQCDYKKLAYLKSYFCH